MKRFISEKSTDELLSLGMALHADKDTMETRIHGIFSRKKSSWIAMSIAFVLALSMGIVCFTTKVQPVTAKQNEVEVLHYNNERGLYWSSTPTTAAGIHAIMIFTSNVIREY